jgi:hypothetical protein
MLNVNKDVTRRVAVPRLRPVTIDQSAELEALSDPVASELEAFRRRRHDSEVTRRIKKV